jgi:hypothetical protein
MGRALVIIAGSVLVKVEHAVLMSIGPVDLSHRW